MALAGANARLTLARFIGARAGTRRDVAAASANFRALLLAILWRRFNTTGAVVEVASGLIASYDELRVRAETGIGSEDSGVPA